MHVEMPTQKVSIDDAVPNTIIEPKQIYDPLLALLNKLCLNYWWAVTGMGVLSAIGLYGWLRKGTLASRLPV